MFIEITNPHLVKQSKNYDLINKQYKINATLKWGIKNGGEIEDRSFGQEQQYDAYDVQI